MENKVSRTSGDFDAFLKGQKDSEAGCTSRMLKAKEKLSQITQDANEITKQIAGYEETLATEEKKLNMSRVAMKEVRAQQEKDKENCRALKKSAGAAFDQYTAERTELEQIATAD